jgi:hypothetical protein
VYGLLGVTVHRLFALTIFLVWACFVSYLAWNHVVWRDEVRALSLALQGDNLIAMLKGLHGEGHPAIWYLLLRGAHALILRPEVLQLVSLIVAFASILLLILRSPFGLLLIALLLSSRFALFEYSVMARNYGISMLLLFLLATTYKRYRDRGILLGALLFLLANCNVHSVFLVGSFLIFWFFDLIRKGGVDRTQVLHTFLLNASIAILGIVLCVMTVFPPFNDAAQIALPDGITFKLLLKAVFLPSDSFDSLLPLYLPYWVMEKFSLWRQPYMLILTTLMSSLMFGSTLVLVRRPAALLAACAALIGFSLFFSIIYPGGYRHQALWFVFLISMYWITYRDDEKGGFAPSTQTTTLIKAISMSGYVLVMAVLALQVIAVRPILAHIGVPLSRSRDLGFLIARSSELQDAIVIADPDYLLEPLSYYVPNRTYFMRERRFGNIVVFTRKAILRLSLYDILTDARNLRTEFGKPVIILLKHRLDPSESAQVIREGYNWELSTTPEQVRTFQAATHFIERFGPVFNSDESFDVYVVD